MTNLFHFSSFLIYLVPFIERCQALYGLGISRPLKPSFLACLPGPEPILSFFDRKGFYLHVLNPNIGSFFDCLDDLIDLRFLSLDFHDHAAVPFVFHPADASIQIRRMTCPIAEAHALHPAGKNDALSYYLLSWHVLHVYLLFLQARNSSISVCIIRLSL